MIEQAVVDSVVNLAITLVLGLGISVAMWAAYLYASRIKDERIRGMVMTFVEAAEQLYKDQAGQTKLDWVFGELRRLFPRIDAGLLRAMIEQAVLSIRLYAERAEEPAPVQLQLVGFQPAPPAADDEETATGAVQMGRHAFQIKT